jgi:hypothetical protein
MDDVDALVLWLTQTGLDRLALDGDHAGRVSRTVSPIGWTDVDRLRNAIVAAEGRSLVERWAEPGTWQEFTMPPPVPLATLSTARIDGLVVGVRLTVQGQQHAASVAYARWRAAGPVV